MSATETKILVDTYLDDGAPLLPYNPLVTKKRLDKISKIQQKLERNLDNTLNGEQITTVLDEMRRTMELSSITEERILINIGQIAFDTQAEDRDRLQASKMLLEYREGKGIAAKDWEINIRQLLKDFEKNVMSGGGNGN
jgi:hypothetical protein